MTDHRKRSVARQWLLALGVALLVGLLSVGSQAVLPTGWGPSALEAALQFFVAVVLAASASYITTEASNRISNPSVQDQGSSAKRPSKTFLRRPKFWGFLLAFTTVAICSIYLYRPLLPPSLAGPEHVGGLDIGKYCTSHGFNGKYKEACYLHVEEEEICNWQHKKTDWKLEYTDPKDLESGICFDDKGRSTKKGIEAMLAFCQTKFPQISNITYEKRTEVFRWHCEIAFDRDVICISQYREKELVAIKDEKKDAWGCYRPRKL
ncbi:hypothetical protein HII36_13595 [Nonomuraea sp. NN258]|uniref:hypothetical protein n=1 Tax=Nonomuraea antri TaxID=2730852 RepID=UPI0015696852|nr:hypothetical protein [Nonomuraea antri]NRQ32867.1 hypothetical protein [Nonomuraea antri]